MNKFVKYFLIILPIAIVIIFVMLEMMSRSAAVIFNKVMTEQDMLKGTITVEKIKATPLGEVTFNNFLWKDDRDNTIIDIEEGSFKVRLWDVLTKNFKSTTIQELSLNNANISLNLDENMNVDFIRHSSDFKKVNQEMKNNSDSWETKISRVNKTEEELKKIGEQRRKLQKSKIESGWNNFNLAGRKINLHLQLNDCQIEIFYRDRHYLFRGVKFETNINTDNEMIITARTGKFGGTMIGRAMEIHGKIDFKTKDIPQCNLTILLQEVDPSSLGFGLNIHDEMTLLAHFTGEISQPVGEGSVKMKELHIPGLDFTNVEGDINYKDSMLNFTNVIADVYDGKLSAYGDYNVDTRYYNIYGHGDKLKTYSALPKSHLHCNVDLDLTIQSKGNAKETITSGSFVSDKGRYRILTIDGISGKFKTEYRNINFYDVEIDIGHYKIATDALSIIDKKLNLSPIKITDENGELIKTFVRE
ncbi:MAG: hypothetical protein IJ728_01665 [Selenomonadaceae bacterium]|nr:hypothetical protein [Selenomonadaceae bacterium]